MSYNVWCPELGDTENEAAEITAMNRYDAAEIWAELLDEADAEIADRGKTLLVCVRVAGSDNVCEMFVSGELKRVYSVRLKAGGEV